MFHQKKPLPASLFPQNTENFWVLLFSLLHNQLKSQYRKFAHSGKTKHTWAEAESLYIIVYLFSQAPLGTYHRQVSRRRWKLWKLWKLWNIPSYVVQWKLAAFPYPSARRAHIIMICTGLTAICDDNAPWQSVSVSLCQPLVSLVFLPLCFSLLNHFFFFFF